MKTKIFNTLKMLYKTIIFLYKKIISFIEGLVDQSSVFYLILLIGLYTIQIYYFNIWYYNNSCSPLLSNQSGFCSYLSVNVYLFIPELLFLWFLFFSIISVSSAKKINWKEFNLMPLAHIIILYLILRFITVQNIDFPILTWLYRNYYLVWEYFIIVVFVLFFWLTAYRKWDIEVIKIIFNSWEAESEKVKEIVINKEEKEDDFNEKITKSIKTALPWILNRILSWTNFRKISFDQEWNLKSNLLTIKSVTFEDETHVFVELNVHIDLIDAIVDLNKYDWTLWIHSNSTNWNIKNFEWAKWRSKDWRNGLLLKIKEKTIDMTETYPYPFLFETNPLIKHPLDVMIWKTRLGEDKVINLWKMPHLMVAWSTWMWKSVEISDIITSLQKNILHFWNDTLHINIVDPKVVDFDIYKELTWIRVVNDPNKALNMLKFYVAEMERRYNLIAWRRTWDKNIDEYNSTSKNKLSYEVIVMDEIADLMMGAKDLKKEFEYCIARLWQKARAAWIHLVLWTQRPDADIITWIIKANIPSVIWFWVTNSINSRIIMDDNSLVWIKNQGECILKTLWELTKIKSYFISKAELTKFIDYYKAEILKKDIISTPPKFPEVIFDENIVWMIESNENEEDSEIIEKAIQIIKESNKWSASLLQRKLWIWYARAAKLLDILEELWVVWPANWSTPREVIIDNKINLESNPYVLMEHFPLFLKTKWIDIDRLDPNYQLLSHLIEKNWYKNRDTLRDLWMNFWFTARAMENLWTALKNNGYVLFDEKQKTNILNISLNNDNLLDLYNFIVLNLK